MDDTDYLRSVMDQEGWSLAELYQVRCIVAAPYVVPYRYVNFYFAG